MQYPFPSNRISSLDHRLALHPFSVRRLTCFAAPPSSPLLLLAAACSFLHLTVIIHGGDQRKKSRTMPGTLQKRLEKQLLFQPSFFGPRRCAQFAVQLAQFVFLTNFAINKKVINLTFSPHRAYRSVHGASNAFRLNRLVGLGEIEVSSACESFI